MPNSVRLTIPHNSRFIMGLWAFLCLLYAAGHSAHLNAAQPTLEARLQAEGLEALAEEASKSGDPSRGAVVLHRTGCTRCHAVDGSKNSLGPDLTNLPRDVTGSHLVESVLWPSRKIRKGFETVVVVTTDGKTRTGLLIASTPNQVEMRDPTSQADSTPVITIPRDKIESESPGMQSLMPAVQVNQLTDRQQFLDLIRYLMEIHKGGLTRARELQPAPALLALQLPEYERNVDHAGIIQDLNQKALERGERIYRQLCINCHGTREQPGSLPTSLPFATGKFKSGRDPYGMYQTLTQGFGLMMPQSWMVPQQKYDVIHYIREAYLKPYNPTQLVDITPEYLKNLPRGTTRGPAPRVIEPWVTMDYGPTLINTYEIGNADNIAQKGIAIRLDPGAGGISRGHQWLIFEHDTCRMAGAWSGTGFIDWNGIHFNGSHGTHPRIVGDIIVSNPTGPGWANPETGSFLDDARIVGRDNRRYGPLPSSWARYRGLTIHDDRAIISYQVGQTDILEMPELVRLEQENPETSVPVFQRQFHIGPRSRAMHLLVATSTQNNPSFQLLDHAACIGGTTAEGTKTKDSILVGLGQKIEGVTFYAEGKRLCMKIAAGTDSLDLALWMTRRDADPEKVRAIQNASRANPKPNWNYLLAGGKPHWNQVLTTEALLPPGKEEPFLVDILTHPEMNPWLAQMRFTGLDFHPDGDRLFVTAWDGDVWQVSGISGLDAARKAVTQPRLQWRRIASGLFQPLGIKIVKGDLYVTCRDQLVILRDRNGDGEIDFYECFNSDHQVTQHFHEFAMGLQVDEAGNFYYAKSARHALPAVVPHHGTLLRVSPDGSRTEILANGFRAANGVCLNPDGSVLVTDQEGHWTPKNRINWVIPGQDRFYGNMFGYHNRTDSSDTAMEQPLCWITNAFDRSPAELVWVPGKTWGPLGGSLLNTSYGYGKIYVVPFEEVRGQKQGGMCQLPFSPLPTGVMRGRFNPIDQQLYACGMFAWAGSATKPGGLYRIRYTGKPMFLPIALHANSRGMEIGFTDPLDRTTATNITSYTIKTWDLKRSANYGSDHRNEKLLKVEAAELSPDGKTVTLVLPQIQPTWGMEIVCRIKSVDGTLMERIIHNSVFNLDPKVK